MFMDQNFSKIYQTIFKVVSGEGSEPVLNSMGLILPAGILDQLDMTSLQNLPRTTGIQDQSDRSEFGLQVPTTTINSQVDRAANYQV